MAELAPALYRNTSIKVLDLSGNYSNDMESAEIFRDILRSNKTLTALDLSGNEFGRTAGAVDCIAAGLRSNSTPTEIDLSSCAMGGISIQTHSVCSRNTTLQKLTLGTNSITYMTVDVLVETMAQSSHHIIDLEL